MVGQYFRMSYDKLLYLFLSLPVYYHAFNLQYWPVHYFYMYSFLCSIFSRIITRSLLFESDIHTYVRTMCTYLYVLVLVISHYFHG